MVRDSLKQSLFSVADDIERHPRFEKAIRLHYEALLNPYAKRPFFYKNALQFNRMLVSFSLLSHYFDNPEPLLSQVKEFCVARKLFSPNSLESFFLVLKALGFIELRPHLTDARLRVFKLSSKACKEVRMMLASMIDPLTEMGADRESMRQLSMLDDNGYMAVYFKGMSQILKQDLSMDHLLPECHWLVKREGGHLLMLAIYLDACVDADKASGFKSSSYLALASSLSVSKMHIIRLVQEGVGKDFFKVHDNSELEVLPAFVSVVRRFMSLSFAMALQCTSLKRINKPIGITFSGEEDAQGSQAQAQDKAVTCSCGITG
nr:hypothetical protein [Pseudomonas viridiflava]